MRDVYKFAKEGKWGTEMLRTFFKIIILLSFGAFLGTQEDASKPLYSSAKTEGNSSSETNEMKL